MIKNKLTDTTYDWPKSINVKRKPLNIASKYQYYITTNYFAQKLPEIYEKY